MLIIRNDGAAGGMNYSSGAFSVRNPVNGITVPINTGEVGNGSKYGNRGYLYVYSSHEVFEARTDGVSGDCCDGETAYGGKSTGAPRAAGPLAVAGRTREISGNCVVAPSGTADHC